MVTRRAPRPYSDTFAYEPTTARERAAAGIVGAALVIGLLLVAPFARMQTGPVPGFVAMIEAIVVVTTLFTASLLYAQFRMRRHAPLALLASAYALLGSFHALFLLTFPGAFAPNGLFGSGPQTAAWLGTASELGFVAIVLAYAYLERSRARSARWQAGVTARICAAAAAYVLLSSALAVVGQRFLPAVVLQGGGFGPLELFALLPVMGGLPVVAAFVVFRVCGTMRRAPLWLGVVVLTSALQVVADVLGGGRYTVGWYVAELYLAVGSMLFFCVMLSLLSSILRKAAQNGERTRALAEIVALGSDTVDRNTAMLERTARDLHFDWAFLAQVDDGWVTLDGCVGEAPYPAAYSAPLAGDWVLEALGRGELSTFDSDELPWCDDSLAFGSAWSTAVAVPIYINESLYGFAGFANMRRRDMPLSDADRTILKLVGALAGATVQRTRQQQRLDELAFFDSLTRLPNRVLLNDRLKCLVAEGERYKRAFAVHYLDLDGFKEVNDTYGHAAGDAVLVEVARRLQAVVRESDTVARLGGDEFVVVQSQVGDPKDVDRLAARLRIAFDEPVAFGKESVTIGTSIGTSRFPRDGRDVQALLVRADQQLYRAKERGRREPLEPSVAFLSRKP
jgi:diguanylate cyclase (GGDEF)-like protein